MNSGVTINIPEMGWPAVFLILALLLLWRSGYLVKKGGGKKRRSGSKPKQSAKPKAARGSGKQIRVPLNSNRPNSISDIQ